VATEIKSSAFLKHVQIDKIDVFICPADVIMSFKRWNFKI